MTQTKGIYFSKLEIENFRCFGQKQVLDLSQKDGSWRKWTIILGDNGTGKTSILQLLAAFELEKDSNGNEFPIGFKSKNTQVTFLNDKVGSAKIKFNISPEAEDDWESGPELLLNDSDVFGLKSMGYRIDDTFECFGYGGNRFMSFNSLTESKSENSETLFNDDAKLINAEEWLLQLDYAASKDSEIKAYAITRRDKVKKILIDLLPDISDILFSTPTKERLKSFLEFKTPYGWVNVHQLSLGYKTMVAWIVDLAARMFERYPDSENPLAEPAVVLVDEIDLHLHPKWQRKIFNYLNNLFPNTQFIVTAHSPLVVQSAPEDANIVLLKREEDHIVIDQNIESVNAWRLDQILTSDLFGIESARGPEITNVLVERKELLQKSKLTNDEETRLKELNKIVHNLPTAENEEDRKAMDIIRKAAEVVKNK